MSDYDAQAQQRPRPDPALKRPDRFVGSGENNIRGQTTYRWLPGGFILEQRIEMDCMGMKIHSPTPLPYRWEADGDNIKFSVFYGPLDATFTGQFSEDGNDFSSSWRPNSGADETVNVPYDIEGSRLK